MTDQWRNTSTPATPPPLPPLVEWFNIATGDLRKGRWYSAGAGMSQRFGFSTPTNELCEEAKKRIWTELSSHYADAVRAHLEEGLSQGEAERAAVKALGNPEKARREFRKTYATEVELWLLDFAERRTCDVLKWHLASTARRGCTLFWIAGIALVSFITLGMTAADPSPKNLALACYFFGMFGSQILSKMLSWRCKTAQGRVVVLYTSTAPVFLSGIPVFLCFGRPFYLGYLGALTFAFIVVLHTRRCVLLWRKLGKGENNT